MVKAGLIGEGYLVEIEAEASIKNTKPNWKDDIKDLLSNFIKSSWKILRFKLLLFCKNTEKIKYKNNKMIILTNNKIVLK